VDGRAALLHALDGERNALPAAERYVARVLSADTAMAVPERPTLTEVAEAVAAQRRSLASTLTENWSTSQRCVLALVAGEPGAAEPPYDDNPVAAWGRLDDRQRDLVERLAPAVVERFNLRR